MAADGRRLVLLPIKEEYGRVLKRRWGLDYRHTFRRRRDAVRAIRKGRL